LKSKGAVASWFVALIISSCGGGVDAEQERDLLGSIAEIKAGITFALHGLSLSVALETNTVLVVVVVVVIVFAAFSPELGAC
jgi:hypothetical protein